jgi:DNA-binding HxlR family transcriptional regulator
VAKTRTYHHFCPVARSLEVIGEKWSLLIVRDLLRGPQRFTDLQRYLGGITPKWLTLRLRDLEAAGIVERDSAAGRREVWYRLTSKGRELAPVVEALAVWGVDHAMRPPLPDEPVHPERAVVTMVTFRNHRGVHLSGPAVWLLRFPGWGSYTIRYDGARWTYERGDLAADERPDVTVDATPLDFVNFIVAARRDRAARLSALTLTGAPEAVAGFLATFGLKPAPVAS